MKRVITMIFSAVVLLAACKKEKTVLMQETKALSAIYINDVISEKFFYTTGRKIEKLEHYNNDGTLYSTDHFEYDATGSLLAVYGILANGSLKTKMIYTKNAAGQIISGDFTNVGVTSYTMKYEYSPGNTGLVIRTAQLGDGGEEHFYTEYDYASGVVKEQRYYQVSPAGTPVLTSRNNFVLTTNAEKIDHYKSLKAAFPRPQPDSWYMYQLLDSASTHYYNGEVIIGERSSIISDRQYDGKGCLTSMIVTIKNITPAAADQVRKIQYEYSDL